MLELSSNNNISIFGGTIPLHSNDVNEDVPRYSKLI
jgi:hypothetical protein